MAMSGQLWLTFYPEWKEANPNNWIVMQSTGLTDNAGVELFERDILKNHAGRLFEGRWNLEYAALWLRKMGPDVFANRDPLTVRLAFVPPSDTSEPFSRPSRLQ